MTDRRRADGVIMCGGRGTRLYPETARWPKALLSIGDTTPLDLMIGHFARHGIDRVVLCAGFQASVIFEHVTRRAVRRPTVDDTGALTAVVETAASTPAAVVVVDTGPDTPTGGRLYQVQGHLRGADFVVAYSDVLSDVDLVDLMAFHRRTAAAATVTTVRAHSPFGHVQTTDGGVVTALVEKPLLSEWVNIGFVAMKPAVLHRVSPVSDQLERELLPGLVAEGRLAAFRHTGSFEPMDTAADRERLCQMWRAGQMAWAGGVPPP